MKKTIALLMTLALVISAVAIPVLAEEPAAVDQVTSAAQATRQNGQPVRGGRGGRQMPGQNGQNGQVPQMPGQNGQNGQMPQMPGQNGQNGQMPQMPGKGGRNSRQGGFKGDHDDRSMKHGTAIFDRLLADGVITQETYDAIAAWIQQQMPQVQQNAETPAEGTAPTEGTAPADGTEPPALPDGTAPAENTDEQAELLKSLLESGVITQEQYDLLVSALQTPPAPPAAPEAQSGT